MEYADLLRWLHVLGATILIGTGSGIAFFMVMAHRTADARLIAHTANIVVLADWIFTATAAIAQPITGVLLAIETGWALTEGWILISLVLYGIIAAFWLPVIWIQHQMRNIARNTVHQGNGLPATYFQYFRIWILCGLPAFLSILTILWLMIARPSL